MFDWIKAIAGMLLNGTRAILLFIGMLFMIGGYATRFAFKSMLELPAQLDKVEAIADAVGNIGTSVSALPTTTVAGWSMLTILEFANFYVPLNELAASVASLLFMSGILTVIRFAIISTLEFCKAAT